MPSYCQEAGGETKKAIAAKSLRAADMSACKQHLFLKCRCASSFSQMQRQLAFACKKWLELRLRKAQKPYRHLRRHSALIPLPRCNLQELFPEQRLRESMADHR